MLIYECSHKILTQNNYKIFSGYPASWNDVLRHCRSGKIETRTRRFATIGKTIKHCFNKLKNKYKPFVTQSAISLVRRQFDSIQKIFLD